MLEGRSAAAAGFALPGLLDAASVAVTDDGDGVAQALVRELKTRGLKAAVVKSVPEDAGAVIFLGGLRAFASIDEAAAANKEGFLAAKAVARRFTESGGAFVAVQDTGGRFGLDDADGGVRSWAAGLTGLVKTAAREWPKAGLKAVDLERGGRPPKALARALADELFFGGRELEVGLAVGGERTVPVLAARPQNGPAKGAEALPPGAVVVVSGGARGVTAGSLIEWSRKARLKFAILGRTLPAAEPAELAGAADEKALKTALLQAAKASGKPMTPRELQSRSRGVLAGREIAETLRALRANGSEAEYLALDVREAREVAKALEGVRAKWGPVAAVVHGAGTLEDKLIADKTPEQYDAVFDTKVRGLGALLEATAGDPLRALILFSSVAGRYGNIGQSDYAIANEVLNKVARDEAKRRGASCVVRALDWGPWDGGMVTPALRHYFTSMGVSLIPLQAGAEFMVAELAGPAGSGVEIVVAGSPDEPDMPAPDAGADRIFDLLVDPSRFPVLESHAINGKVVVPFVLAADWLYKAAAALLGKKGGVAALTGLRTLRGIKIGAFAKGPHRFRIVAKEVPGGLALELNGADGTPYYRARAKAGARAAADPREFAEPRGTSPAGLEKPYTGKLLFHGPDFQVIQSDLGASDEALAATLKDAAAERWAPALTATPALFLDGALQMGILLGAKTIGRRVLPMGAESVEYHADGPLPATVRCAVRIRSKKPEGIVYDAFLCGPDGAPIAAVRGLDAVAIPNEEPVSL